MKGLDLILSQDAKSILRQAMGTDEPSTWRPVDLSEAVEGGSVPPPELWTRTDGEAFIYPGRVHWFQGESESLKSLAAQVIAAEELQKGKRVLYIDFEDDELGVVSHLLALGVEREAILERFTYLRPDEPLAGHGLADLEEVLAKPLCLAVIDGVTEAMTTEGLEVISNTDVARWMRLLPKRVARIEGTAVICIDHVSKASDASDRYALGGQHKLAGVSGATYRFSTVKPLTRPRGIEPEVGMVDVTVTKDRPGWIRRNTLGGKIGTFTIESYPDGTLKADLVPPGEAGPDHELVSEILRYLRDYDGSSKTAIEEGVEGKTVRIRDALRWMADEGRWWIRIEKKGQSHLHWLTDEGRAELGKRW